MSIEKALTKLSKTNQELVNKLVTAAANKESLPKTAQQYLDIVKANKVKTLSVSCKFDSATKNDPFLSWTLKVEFDTNCSLKTFIVMKRALEKFAYKFDGAYGDVDFNIPGLDNVEGNKYYFTVLVAEKNPKDKK